jgi:fumarate hydratase class I
MNELEYPFSEEKVRKLDAGSFVRLAGPVFTARDRLHKYLHEGGRLPVDLKDGAIYHCGPVVVQVDGLWVIRAAGPTTSMREEPYMPGIIRKHGVRIVIGKGGMGEGTVQACRECGCAYLETVGGAACVVAGSIRAVGGVYFMGEFGKTEAMWKLIVAGLDCIVSIDAHGRSLHEEVRNESGKRLKAAFRRPHTDY